MQEMRRPPRAVDDDLQVQRRGHHMEVSLQGWVSVNRTLVGSGQGWSTRVPAPKKLNIHLLNSGSLWVRDKLS